MRSKQVFGKFQFWYLLDRSVTFHSPILQIGITQEFGKLRKKYLVCWCGKRKHFSRLNLFTCILILLIKMLIMLSSCQLLVPVFGLTVSHSEKLGLEIYIQNCVLTLRLSLFPAFNLTSCHRQALTRLRKSTCESKATTSALSTTRCSSWTCLLGNTRPSRLSFTKTWFKEGSECRTTWKMSCYATSFLLRVIDDSLNSAMSVIRTFITR